MLFDDLTIVLVISSNHLWFLSLLAFLYELLILFEDVAGFTGEFGIHHLPLLRQVFIILDLFSKDFQITRIHRRILLTTKRCDWHRINIR